MYNEVVECISYEYYRYRSKIRRWISKTFTRPRLVYSSESNKSIRIPESFTYSLDYSVAEFMAAAMTAFMEHSFSLVGPPSNFEGNEDDWENMVTKIRDGFKAYADTVYTWPDGATYEDILKMEDDAVKLYQESLQMFSKYIGAWWW